MLDDLKSLLQTQRERLRHHGKTISGSTQTKNFRTVSWRRELCAGALLAVWHRAEHVIFVVQAAFRRRNRTDPKRAISDTGRDAVPLNRKLDFSGERLLPKFTLKMRLEVVHRLQPSYSIHALCRVLSFNPSTFYRHECRAPEKTLLEIERTKRSNQL